jgi:uncharacterized protein
MTPNEKSMIEDLFGRIRATAMPDRDAEAQRLIEAEMARTPGAAYALAQTVLVQDQALRQAADQIKTLQEAAKRDLAAEPAAGGGSFLDRVGLGSRPGAVPRTGSPADMQAPPMAPPGGGGGGFLSGALQTAAGVAGGALLFEGVRSLFGGSSGGLGSLAGFGGLGGSPWGATPTVNETVINEAPKDDSRGDDRIEKADYSSDDTSDDTSDDSDDGGDWSDDGYDDGESV